MPFVLPAVHGYSFLGGSCYFGHLVGVWLHGVSVDTVALAVVVVVRRLFIFHVTCIEPSRRGGGRSARTPATRPCRSQSSKSSSPPPLYQSSRRHRHRSRFCTSAATTLRRQRTTQSRASVIASSSSRLCQWRTPCASASQRATGRRVSMRYSGTWMAWSTIST